MIYYVLPGVGRYGGVKKAFQCVDMLNESGYAAAAATPGGDRPAWFETSAPVIDRADLSNACTASDVVFFSWPPDADFAASLPAEVKIVHMQGANTDADLALIRRSDEFRFISHGYHMSCVLLRHDVIAPYVPNSVPHVFRHSGQAKQRNSIAYMPRKGGDVAETLKRQISVDVHWREIDGATEREVAETLKSSDIFLALSPSEAFGLPPLEAMSAGCCVVGYPGDGGLEFMHHGETAHVVANNDAPGLVRALRDVLRDPGYREYLRQGGFDYSAYYTPQRERDCLIRALQRMGLGAQTRQR